MSDNGLRHLYFSHLYFSPSPLFLPHKLNPLLSMWPVDRPARWLETVNLPQGEAAEKMVKESIKRNRPLGGDGWVRRMAERLNLGYTLRPRGRPVGWRKKGKAGKKER